MKTHAEHVEAEKDNFAEKDEHVAKLMTELEGEVGKGKVTVADHNVRLKGGQNIGPKICSTRNTVCKLACYILNGDR